MVGRHQYVAWYIISFDVIRSCRQVTKQAALKDAIAATMPFLVTAWSRRVDYFMIFDDIHPNKLHLIVHPLYFKHHQHQIHKENNTCFWFLDIFGCFVCRFVHHLLLWGVDHETQDTTNHHIKIPPEISGSHRLFQTSVMAKVCKVFQANNL